ncbi:DUF4498 domain-containing protein [archaeon]|nr:MAG: DUF4498 domain-containing protein [archaeon]
MPRCASRVAARVPARLQDEVAPYLDATRAAYKDLIAVARDASAPGGLAIQTRVFRITGWSVPSSADSKTPLFPTASPHSACWVFVTPRDYTVRVLSFSWVPFW